MKSPTKSGSESKIYSPVRIQTLAERQRIIAALLMGSCGLTAPEKVSATEIGNCKNKPPANKKTADNLCLLSVHFLYPVAASVNFKAYQKACSALSGAATIIISSRNRDRLPQTPASIHWVLAAARSSNMPVMLCRDR